MVTEVRRQVGREEGQLAPTSRQEDKVQQGDAGAVSVTVNSQCAPHGPQKPEERV